MDIQMLVYGTLATLVVAHLLINRRLQVTHQEVPIPVPVDSRRR